MSEQPGPHSSVRILLVEDERLIAKGIERCIQRLGYSVAGSVGSGEQALAVAQELSPSLILLDINLGKGMDGIQTALELRKFLDVPIVFLTAHSDDSTLERAKQAQPSGFVLKPYDDKDLRTAIEIGLFRYQAEREVLLSQRWLGSTLASIGDGVLATDLAGRVCLLNTVAEQITGWSQAEAMGRPVSEVLPLSLSETGEEVENPILGCLNSGQTVHLPLHVSLRRRDGESVPIEDSASPIRDQNGVACGAIMVFRDVSDRRELERNLQQERLSLRQANQQLEQLNQHKDFLLGMVAHDLRNPLSVILGYSHFVQKRLAEVADQKVLRFLSHIQTSAQAMLDLVEELLDVTALESGKLTLHLVPANLAEVTERVVEANQELFENKNIGLKLVQESPTPLVVSVDLAKLEQVLINLLTNAVKYSEPGTTVTVRLQRAEREARLWVEDQGQGIEAEELPTLFKPFGRTSNRPTAGEKSTGLGLAIAQKIIQGHSGRLEVESVRGQGSQFCITLPLLASAAEGLP
ncbi:response regulator [bacterium]|nr:response regulator [bacterium]